MLLNKLLSAYLYLRLDTFSVLGSDLLFASCRNKNVTRFTKQIFDVGVLIRLSTGKALDRSMFEFVFFQSLGIDTVTIDDSCVPFQDTDTSGPVSSEISSRMQTDVTETLDDEANEVMTVHSALSDSLLGR